MKAKQKI